MPLKWTFETKPTKDTKIYDGIFFYQIDLGSRPKDYPQIQIVTFKYEWNVGWKQYLYSMYNEPFISRYTEQFSFMFKILM